MTRPGTFIAWLLTFTAIAALAPARWAHAEGVSFDARSAHGGRWSDAATWENGRLPRAGDRVQIRSGHVVVYDVAPGAGALRMVHVAGQLVFARDRSTELDVQLLKIQPGDEASEDGFNCSIHGAVAGTKHNPRRPEPDPILAPAGADALPAALEVGTTDNPIPAGVTAIIRLVRFPGADPQTLPAVIDCGGRMDLHGAPMARTWVKLGAPAAAGDAALTLAEPVPGWRAGDQVVVTATRQSEFYQERAHQPAEAEDPGHGTERRAIVRVDGDKLQLDRPLNLPHDASDDGRAEVADLSRNVVIESADASTSASRGHTMYHRYSSGGISYAEFRGLGKQGVLGKYPIHFHLVRDTMRGASVIGASIWDSGNRFIAIHGTDYLLVRDCVGYQCIGHGFFLEDATEQYNLLDRNLAIQARRGKPLPDQALDFDQNEGAGFWWANGRNSFVRNVACENDRYGFRFDINKVGGEAPMVYAFDPDGHRRLHDARTIPFLRFEGNESHSEGLYSFDFGDDPDRLVRSDPRHPFIVRHLNAWMTHYAIRPSVSDFLGEDLRLADCIYGVYNPSYDNQVFRDVLVRRCSAEPINRGHDDDSIQSGSFTYDGLRLEGCRTGRDPIIQLTCTSPAPGQTGHFRRVSVVDCHSPSNIVDLGGGPRNDKLENGVVYYFHDSPGAGRATRVVSVKFPGLMTGGDYRSIPGWTGPDVRAAEVPDVPFPKLLDPIDDVAPATIVTSIHRRGSQLIIEGISEDNGPIAHVRVNDADARVIEIHDGIVEWEAALGAAGVKSITARTTDAAGNVEPTPQTVPWR